MPEALSDSSAEIARIFLWDEIVEVFRENAFMLGVQISHAGLEGTDDCIPTRLVLAEMPDEGHESLQLWADYSGTALLARASILYTDPKGNEVFNYEITPGGIKQFSANPTPLDVEDIMDLRYDVKDAEWSQSESEKCAKNLIFFS